MYSRLELILTCISLLAANYELEPGYTLPVRKHNADDIGVLFTDLVCLNRNELDSTYNAHKFPTSQRRFDAAILLHKNLLTS